MVAGWRTGQKGRRTGREKGTRVRERKGIGLIRDRDRDSGVGGLGLGLRGVTSELRLAAASWVGLSRCQVAGPSCLHGLARRVKRAARVA